MSVLAMISPVQASKSGYSIEIAAMPQDKFGPEAAPNVSGPCRQFAAGVMVPINTHLVDGPIMQRRWQVARPLWGCSRLKNCETVDLIT
jgi:hypothetical protein